MRTRPSQKQDPSSAVANRTAIGLAVALAVAMAIYICFLIFSGRLPEVVTRS